MKRAIICLTLILFCRCVAPRSKAANNDLPFTEIQFTLLGGKVGDSFFKFRTNREESFVVEFNKTKFRSFDSGFVIKGTCADSGSSYYTALPYGGFYTLKGRNKCV